MPTGAEICEKQVFSFIDKIEKVKVDEAEIESLLPSVYRKLEWLEKEDLIKRMVAQEFDRLIGYYKEAPEIKIVDETEKRVRRETDRSTQGPEAGYQKLFIGIGKMDGINPKNLMDLINNYVEGRVQIGRIDLYTRYSLFDVEEKSAKRVVDALRELDFLGRNVKVDFATEEQMSRGNNKYDDGDFKRKDSYGKRPGQGGYKSRSNEGGFRNEGRRPYESGSGRGKEGSYGKRSYSGNGSYSRKSDHSSGKSNDGSDRK